MILIDAGNRYIAVTDTGECFDFGKNPPPGVKVAAYQQAILQEATLLVSPVLVKPVILVNQ